MQALALSAISLYEHVSSAGWWYRLWAALRGRPSQLLDLKMVVANTPIRERRAGGTQIVPIRQIQGSEGRAGEFDRAFHPLQQHTELRWRGIAHAWLAGASMPPAELIQIGDIYFVRDGHHRISVAKALGQQEIEAVVTIWQAEQPAAPRRPVVSPGQCVQPRRSTAGAAACEAWSPLQERCAALDCR
jgi:hypothetical protein